MPIFDRPVFTESYSPACEFVPASGSVYVSGYSVEDRSFHADSWRAETSDVQFIDIVSEEKNAVRLKLPGEPEPKVVALRSARQIGETLGSVEGAPIYLDITGLRHHVWAALLRASLVSARKVIVIYVEPDDYRQSMSPTENEIYDLSEAIEGISPLPGFANLREGGDKVCFVPLLGFEGTRVSHMISQLEPPGDKIVPIVGLPGFRPEYPFITYLGNRYPLSQSQGWKKIRFAQANCPFDLFFTLQGIQRSFRDHVLKIAPIGTKPHAVGSVLYAISNPKYVELVYDHPIRKARRTAGTGRLLAYHVSGLMG